MNKFKPHMGWIVRIKLDYWEWEDLDSPDLRDLWKSARDVGITLVRRPEDLDDLSDETQGEDALESEDTADIVVNRGDADFAVKPDDNRVLRCIERDDRDESPEFFQRTSDALRELFKTNSWETIRTMDGFDDGSRHGGNVPYLDW